MQDGISAGHSEGPQQNLSGLQYKNSRHSAINLRRISLMRFHVRTACSMSSMSWELSVLRAFTSGAALCLQTLQRLPEQPPTASSAPD